MKSWTNSASPHLNKISNLTPSHLSHILNLTNLPLFPPFPPSQPHHPPTYIEALQNNNIRPSVSPHWILRGGSQYQNIARRKNLVTMTRIEYQKPPTFPTHHLSYLPNLTNLPPFTPSQPPTFHTFPTSHTPNLNTLPPFPPSQPHHPPIYN